ncbi:putative nepenthesin [Rosa chinensis]|uniref:Putative nepenthesin n=1 Tax=Rosa chinensis TaxID=74649 RepID=A0A2P6S3R0_ROSCH|nr:putative nepenthesin [Rosa chinensis]
MASNSIRVLYMDPGPTSRSVLFRFLLLVSLILHVSGNLVFLASHKFQGRRRQWSLRKLKAHDASRHGRNLLSVSSSAVDLELGGNGHPSETDLYFAKLGIGSQSKDYYVQVDTGNDIFDIGIKLTLYDPKDSSTSQSITCDQDFCTSQYDGQLPGCKPELLCQYNVVYGDGSSTAGYFVKDVIGFDKLAAAGKVKKQFAHCLDNVNGGGIFTIGKVVETKLKLNMTPLVAKSAHYNVAMEAIEVGGDVVDLPSDTFDSGDMAVVVVMSRRAWDLRRKTNEVKRERERPFYPSN